MPITVNPALQRDVIMESALTALRQSLLSLDAFSTAYRDVNLEGTRKMLVPYFPLETSASKDFTYANGYEFGDTYEGEVRELTINKRKYQPLSLTSEDYSRNPQLNPEKIGKLKGIKLAEDVYADIFSIVTAANFGAAVFTGAAAGFDFAALNEEIGTACDESGWPNMMRSVILKSAYYRNLVTDLADASVYGSADPVKRGMLEGVAGFDVWNNSTIPGNGQNLVGIATMPSGILVGFSPIPPKDDKNVVEYETMSDPETGLTLEWRTWFDPDFDTEKTVIECNYGYAVGEADALKRIVSA